MAIKLLIQQFQPAVKMLLFSVPYKIDCALNSGNLYERYITVTPLLYSTVHKLRCEKCKNACCV